MTAQKLLLSTAALALLAISPAFATSGVTASSDASIETATAAESAPSTPETLDPVPATDPMAPATLDAATTAPNIDDMPAVDPATTAAPAETAPTDPMASPATDVTAPAVEDATTAVPADTTAPTTTEAAPAVVEEPAPKPVKKKTPPAKLSALAKKYDLMSLDTDGNKSLSEDEFTAGGFSNAKTFRAYDRDSNGKLTNAEINAYAANIEANNNR